MGSSDRYRMEVSRRLKMRLEMNFDEFYLILAKISNDSQVFIKMKPD